MKRGILICLLLMGLGPVHADEAGKIQGTWSVQKMELLGVAQDKANQEGDFVVGESSLTMKGKANATFDCKFFPDNSPSKIDILSKDGKKVAIHGIYKITGDELLILLVPASLERPTEFKTTKQNQGTMFTLKRKK
jgi:uncharacterized protein (TIGR03067 family)